jgi:hypothetical protein
MPWWCWVRRSIQCGHSAWWSIFQSRQRKWIPSVLHWCQGACLLPCSSSYCRYSTFSFVQSNSSYSMTLTLRLEIRSGCLDTWSMQALPLSFQNFQRIQMTKKLNLSSKLNLSKNTIRAQAFLWYRLPCIFTFISYSSTFSDVVLSSLVGPEVCNKYSHSLTAHRQRAISFWTGWYRPPPCCVNRLLDSSLKVNKG